MDDCKRCLLRESAEEDTYHDIKRAVQKLSEKEKVSEALYANRLSKCKECDFLISGVCMKCGCYVELRAAFANQKCPNASDRRW